MLLDVIGLIVALALAIACFWLRARLIDARDVGVMSERVKAVQASRAITQAQYETERQMWDAALSARGGRSW